VRPIPCAPFCVCNWNPNIQSVFGTTLRKVEGHFNQIRDLLACVYRYTFANKNHVIGLIACF